MHQCPDSGVYQWPTPDLGENRPGSDRRVYGEKAPAGVAPMGGCGCGGGARAPGGMALGLPYASLFAKLHLPRATPSGTLPETPAEGRDGPLGSASTPFLPLEPAKEPLSPRWRQWTCASSKKGSARAGGAGSIRRLQPCRLCVDQAKQIPTSRT